MRAADAQISALRARASAHPPAGVERGAEEQREVDDLAERNLRQLHGRHAVQLGARRLALEQRLHIADLRCRDASARRE
jgi:hypothetical protein